MRVRLNIAKQYRNAALIERGEEIAGTVIAEAPLAELSPEARSVLAGLDHYRDEKPGDCHNMYYCAGNYYECALLPQIAAEWETILAEYAERERQHQAATEARAAQKALEDQARDQEHGGEAAALAARYLAGDEDVDLTDQDDAYLRAGGGRVYYLRYAEAIGLAIDRQALGAEHARRTEIARAARDQAEAQAATEKAAREQERADWIGLHGSERLRAAVGAGYNCQRLYITERAALEYPGYTVDFDDNAEWKPRSCPSTEALAEHLRVAPNLREDESVRVAWLTHGIEADDTEDYDREPYEEREAVVIEYWLRKYDLVRTEFTDPDDPSDYAELPGGYQRLGRTLRHADAVMLLDGHTDRHEIMAQHTLVGGLMPADCPESGPIPAEMQQTMYEGGVEGVWFARPFPSVTAAEEFAASRVARSSRRTRG